MCYSIWVFNIPLLIDAKSVNSELQSYEGEGKRSPASEEGSSKDDVVVITGERENCLEAKAALMVRTINSNATIGR